MDSRLAYKLRNLKVAMVTADTRDGYITELMGDSWNMYYWLYLTKGMQYWFESERLKDNELDKYDVVIFSGYPYYFKKIQELAKQTKAVTIFFPEGDISLYGDKGIFKDYWETIDACSAYGSAEEDKIDYFRIMLTHAKPYFMHIPIPTEWCNGSMRNYNLASKSKNILIYGDNNPNNPTVAVAVARLLNRPIWTNVIGPEDINYIKNVLKVEVPKADGKMSQDEYMAMRVRFSWLMVYPTRWIGTGRQVITGAVCGTPVIGSRDSHTQNRLFPELACANYDMKKMTFLAEKLFDDEKYYRKVCDYALDNMRFYSVENALQRLIKIYEECKE